MAKQSPAPLDPPATTERRSKAFETAHHDYCRQLGDIWDGLTKRIGDAQRAYCDAAAAVKDAKTIEDVHAASDTAKNDLVGAIRAAWDECQGRFADAYAAYLDAHRAAWTSAKAPDIAPDTVAAASQSAASAAAYASATIANPSLIAWAGVPPWVVSTPKSS